MERFTQNRNFMKSGFAEDIFSDQEKNFPNHHSQKPYEDDSQGIRVT